MRNTATAEKPRQNEEELKQEGALAKQETSSANALEVYDFGNDAGAGLEDVRADELITPFIALLQPLSPQLDRKNDAYIEGAREGMFMNSLTGELYDGDAGLECIFVTRDKVYGEWVPRDEGGGFRGTHTPDDPLVLRLLREQGGFKALRTPDGTDLIEQYNLYALVAPPPLSLQTLTQAVIAFTSTKIGPYKRLMSRITALKYPVGGRLVQPPIWAHRWLMKAVPQSNKKGRFWNVDFNLAAGENPANSLVKRDDPLYEMAKGYNDMFKAGKVHASYETAAAAASQASDVGGADGDDPPF